MLAVTAVIVNLIFPGVGHLLLRQYLRGAVVAALFAAAGHVFLLSAVFWQLGVRAPLSLAALGAGGFLWLFALIDGIRMLHRRGSEALKKRQDDRLRAAQIAWLRDDAAAAEENLRAMLAADERDIEAWVFLGKVLKSSGRAAEARRCFQSARNLDGSERWRWQLEEELGPAVPAQVKTEAS